MAAIPGTRRSKRSTFCSWSIDLAAYRQRLIELGYSDVAEDEERLQQLVDGAKAVADQKKVISDADLETLVGDKLYHNWRDHQPVP